MRGVHGTYLVRDGKNSDGIESTFWELVMPRINPCWLDSVFYIFPNREAAERGESGGGTGFFLPVPTSQTNRVAVYAVTNRHVIKKHDKPTIREWKKAQKFGYVDTERDEWHCGEIDDLAVRLMGQYQPGTLAPLDADFSDWLASPDHLEQRLIGIGDEVFMMSRFSPIIGKEKNRPTVRFGYISRLPDEPIEHDGKMCEAFLVEMRSIGGCSGSPVLVHYPSMQLTPSLRIPETHRFLGVDAGHFPYKVRGTIADPFVQGKEVVISTSSAMAVVVPAWKLRELLESPHVVAERDQQDSGNQTELD